MARVLESVFDGAIDPSFKARAISEYRRIRSWTQGHVDLDSANILDFGCGEGVAAASFALRHPGAKVTGVDVAPPRLDPLRSAYKNQIGLDLPDNLSLQTVVDGSFLHEKLFDLAYAWSVFHHIPRSQAVDVAKEIRECLAEGAFLFVQVEPLYFSERGSLLYR